VDRAYEAIDQLPAGERDVLLLRLNGLRNQDVAAVLGIAQSGASKLLKCALESLEQAMIKHRPDDDEDLNSTTSLLLSRLQERYEQELTVAFERMRRHNLMLDEQGRIVGFTAAAQRNNIAYIIDHLRGVLPVYLLRQGVDTSHANEFYNYVVAHLSKDQEALERDVQLLAKDQPTPVGCKNRVVISLVAGVDLRTGQTIQTLQGHTYSVSAVCPLGGGHVLTGSHDNTARVWDLRTGQTIQTLQGHTGSVKAVCALGG
jgi:hypothetical protein